MNLYEKTKYLLRNRPAMVTFSDIEKATGIGEPWLRMLNKKDCTKDPSVNKVQKLYEYLSKKKLKV